MVTPVAMEPLLGYHPCSIGFLTSRRDPAVGQCQTGSLTGAVASERVSEAPKGSLRMDGNHSKSAKAEGSLTATPTGGACSATCRAVSVPPESSHIRRALSRSGFRSLAMRPPRPLSFVFHFSFRALPRKCVKNGPCSKHGPFSGSRRRGGMRRPYRCVHFSQCQL